MQFDDFDKKIIDAANHHHPAYDEKAWDKMEELLDKHLPVQKDNRRRIFFFLLLLVLVGSGAFFLIRGFNKPQSTIAKEQYKDPANALSTEQAATKSTPATGETSTGNDKSAVKGENATEQAAGTKPVPAADDKVANNGNKQVEDPAVSVPGKKSPTVVLPGSTPPGKNAAAVEVNASDLPEKQNGQLKTKTIVTGTAGANKGNQKIVKKIAGHAGNGIPNTPDSKITSDQNNQVAESGTTGNNKNDSAVQHNPLPVTGTQPPPGPKKDNTAIAPDSASQKQDGKKDDAQAESPKPAVSKKSVKKPGKQKRSFFAINLSAGPDLSYVGISELGKVKMRYGAGLGYTFNHFTIRSGFYISKKIYSAEGTYYHPFYASLEKVDGDCKVFEIPVTVSYNFGRTKNHNWFASTGLSSYLMKKETYAYHTKDPVSGNTNLYWKSWDNKNKHYFSVLNLSAGYERYFSKTLSLIAEPYMQIPFAGVGNGKMKLFSSGVQVTLSIKPFTRKR